MNKEVINEQFIREILKNSKDESNFLVYSDWLEDQAEGENDVCMLVAQHIRSCFGRGKEFHSTLIQKLIIWQKIDSSFAWETIDLTNLFVERIPKIIIRAKYDNFEYHYFLDNSALVKTFYETGCHYSDNQDMDIDLVSIEVLALIFFILLDKLKR